MKLSDIPWGPIIKIGAPLLLGAVAGSGTTYQAMRDTAAFSKPMTQTGPIVATLDKDTQTIMRETNRLLRDVANKTVDPVILQCKPQ